MADRHEYLHRFAEAASDFCDMVENHLGWGVNRKGWLQAVGQLLIRLETNVQLLNGRCVEADYSMLQDLEDRFILFQRLKSFLGPLDDYWSEGDLMAGDGLQTGSLADDITDLYFDLKRGLVLYHSGLDAERKAIDLWLYSYHIHWQQHLRDAKKQLFDFRRAH